MKQNFTAVSEESLFRVTRDWLQYTWLSKQKIKKNI
jgi:hypothetical protein